MNKYKDNDKGKEGRKENKGGACLRKMRENARKVQKNVEKKRRGGVEREREGSIVHDPHRTYADICKLDIFRYFSRLEVNVGGMEKLTGRNLLRPNCLT